MADSFRRGNSVSIRSGLTCRVPIVAVIALMSGCGSNSTEPKDGGGTSDARIDSARDAGPGASDAATDSSRWDAVDSGSQEAATNDTSQDAGGGASDARIDSFGDAGSGASDAATDSSRWDAVDSGSQEAATNDTSQNAAPDSWSNGSEGGTLDSPTDAYASREPFRIINYYPSGYAWYAMWDSFGGSPICHRSRHASDRGVGRHRGQDLHSPVPLRMERDCGRRGSRHWNSRCLGGRRQRRERSRSGPQQLP